MTWSTREVAELAGTSLRAVRHYHEIGLLPEPERRANGYKQYGVEHLVRLLRIKRLVDLGFSLTTVAGTLDDDVHPEEAVRALDAELAATIDRLQRARAELGPILRGEVPTDLPTELAGATDQPMSDADRALSVVLPRVLGSERLRAVADMLREVHPDPAQQEFDALPADADEATRDALVARMAPYLRAIHDAHPGLRAPDHDAPVGRARAAQTLGRAMRELYNPAQLDVLVRATRTLPGAAEAAG
ncbi:MerR family transcriptional regulator [Pseudonocardia spirodelae]|uniref:MerR family transcriptional regulator n=1 Tax=Pseudonocardia spirodelae TaxID=3133431 RepID=A0ABU8TA75_9PSEU